MSKIGRWRKIFGFKEKPKIPVRVGDKHEDLTGTQAYRFEQLTQSRHSASGNRRYTLAEASGQLNISEIQLLRKAAAGFAELYIDAGGLTGRWRRGRTDGSSTMTAEQTLTSGLLALSSRSCSSMASDGSIIVSTLAFRCSPDPSSIGIDRETMEMLSAWGECEKHFCLREPLRVDQDKIVILAPLPDSLA